jgi:hypothetical protein
LAGFSGEFGARLIGGSITKGWLQAGSICGERFGQKLRKKLLAGTDQGGLMMNVP